jgi:hypothetical protein
MDQANAIGIVDATARVPDHIVYRAFAAETVVLNIKTGRYHGLNPTAGRMLETLERVGGVRDCAAILAEQYKQPQSVIEKDLAALCLDLEARGLIVIERARSG